MFSSLSVRVLQIGWTKLGEWWNYRNLSAPYWRFYWNDNIGASIFFDGKFFELSPDYVYLIAPDTPFSSKNEKRKIKPGHFYIHFTVETDELDLPSKIFLFKISDSELGLINKIIEFNEKENNYTASMKAISLVSHFLSSIQLKTSGELHRSKAKKALEILKNHCEKGISNTELASKISMSTNSFLRFFRQNFGITPQKYLRQLRIERACFMLHYTDKSIKEIADSLGFSDRYHFTKVFSQIRKESPAVFRKKLYRTQNFS